MAKFLAKVKYLVEREVLVDAPNKAAVETALGNDTLDRFFGPRQESLVGMNVIMDKSDRPVRAYVAGNGKIAE